MKAPFARMPAEDSRTHAESANARLRLERRFAIWLGETAVEFGKTGIYLDSAGGSVDVADSLRRAMGIRETVPPDVPLSVPAEPGFASMRVRVVNDTTLALARELVERDEHTSALNFANGVHPGGGFRNGALAQEETLCRSSALYATLAGDPMYAAHRKQRVPESSAWIIRSPLVPVFRTDDGQPLDEPWHLNFMTCAAPYAPYVGQPRSHELLDDRIGRVLELAAARGHTSLVLGAWGCGAFQNDPAVVADLFRKHLEAFAGHFREVVFALTDWSEERRTFRPFADALALAS